MGTHTIQTQAYIDAQDDLKVGLSGDETIIGVKTFNDSPLVPTQAVSTSNATAANTAYTNQLFDAKFEGFLPTGLSKQFSGDLDSILYNSTYTISSTGVTNEPTDMSAWGFLRTIMHTNTSYATQMLYSMNSGNGIVWMRQRGGSVWGSWVRLDDASNLKIGTIDDARLPIASASASGIITTGTQTLTGAKTFNSGLDVPGNNGTGLSLEGGKHNFTSNDGKGNFNIRVGHSSSELCTEAGRPFHMEWSTSGGTMQFNTSIPSLAVNDPISWTESFKIGPTVNNSIDIDVTGNIGVTGDIKLANSGFTNTMQSGVLSGDVVHTLPIVSGDISATVNSIFDLLEASSGTVFVKDYHSDTEGGGGTFVWDATKLKSEHNGGTIIDPTATFPTDWSNQTQLATWFETSNIGSGTWVRKVDGAANVKDFGVRASDAQANQAVQLSTIFANTPDIYAYEIPHDINYGLDNRHSLQISVVLTLPNKDGIIYDSSVDNGYIDPAHQGGQTRTFYMNKDATSGGHNGFNYLSSLHHIGDMYLLEGDGIFDTNKLVRNATSFYGCNGEVNWGIGQGGNAITVVDPLAITTAEQLLATNFKLVANNLRGVTGLTNVMNISNTTANVGWFSGVEPTAKYTFTFQESDVSNSFQLRSGKVDNSFPSVYRVNNANIAWSETTTELDIREFTPDGERFRRRKEGNYFAALGISGNITTTAARPSAGLLTAGSMMYDSTLNKPIWLLSAASNTWRDANGTIV